MHKFRATKICKMALRRGPQLLAPSYLSGAWNFDMVSKFFITFVDVLLYAGINVLISK